MDSERVKAIAKELLQATIETRVRELKELARPELLHDDVREARFVQHTLQIAIQAALDIASHIVSARRLGEPDTNRALFDLLRRRRVIDDAHGVSQSEEHGGTIFCLV